MNTKTNALADVETLSVECIDIKPVEIDWQARYGVDMDGWRVIDTLRCSYCDETPPDDGREFEPNDPCDLCANDGVDGRYVDWIERDAGPMMNYYYPLPDYAIACGKMWSEDDARKLDDLPLCLVEFDDDSHALALTGGGMDLSWEVCEAFMRLGFLPPFHFELPAMCGRGSLSNGGEYGSPVSERDAWIIAGCRRSAEVIQGWATRRLERLAEVTR